MGYFLLSKSTTTSLLHVSELLLLLFGLILTVGALGEYKKFPKLLRFSHSTFELLVVIGIAGEMVADGAVFVFSGRLQTISDGEFAGLNREAASARKEAGIAVEHSKALDNSTQHLKTDAQRSKERADKLETGLEAERIKTLRFQRQATDSQRLLSEQLERERVESIKSRKQLEGKIGDRFLNPQQTQFCINSLQEFRGTSVDVVIFDNPEPKQLGDGITTCLIQAGWIVNSFTTATGGINGVLAGAKPEAMGALSALVGVLNLSGLGGADRDLRTLFFTGGYISQLLMEPERMLHLNATQVRVLVGSK